SKSDWSSDVCSSDIEAFDKASTVFLEFMQRLEQEGRRKSIAYGNTLQAIAYNELRQDKFEDALHNYEKALEIYQSIPNCKEEKRSEERRVGKEERQE